MRTGSRITAFAAALAAAFGTAYGVGQTFDPVVADRPRRTRSGMRRERASTRQVGCRSPRVVTPSICALRR